MPNGPTDESATLTRGSQAIQVGVYRYAPSTAQAAEVKELLPYIRVLLIEYREGNDPGFARFSYVFDQTSPEGIPKSFEEVLSINSTIPGVVQTDERLIVQANAPSGDPVILFDGFAQVPELSLASGFEEVTFSAQGVAYRLWDDQIAGAMMRDADRPEVVSDCITCLPVRFNPQAEPNATPSGADAGSNGKTYATFLDPLVRRVPDIRRHWTLPMAVRYLCYHENSAEQFVTNPAPSVIDDLLVAHKQTVSGTTVTSSTVPIIVPDFLATGLSWPDALHQLLTPEGFGMVFRLDTNPQGEPATRLELFRKQDPYTTAFKVLRLQPYGSAVDSALSNLQEAQIVRDVTEIENRIAVDAALPRYEASFILAPGFSIDRSDAQDADSIARFSLNHPSFATVRNKYRLYLFDETGEGHWDKGTSKLVKTAPSLAPLLGTDSSGHSLRRRRIPISELFSLDEDGRSLKATLSVSTDYQGPQPGLWDGTGTWQKISGGFELTEDRLGIWVNSPNPNGWNIHGSGTSTSPVPSGILKGVEDQARVDGRPFVLRLTCVIEGDNCQSIVAERRASSPTKFTRTRRVQGKSRYFKHIISQYSEYNSSGLEFVARDDSDEALTEARNRRLNTELGRLAGHVTIPCFTTDYRIGDRIGAIEGRNLSFRLNAGAEVGESDVYPAVVGITWSFVGGAKTILQLSDQRANQS